MLIKGSNYLEALAKAETVVFDKTGTLTKGSFAVTRCYPRGITGERLLELAACAEKDSNHPISRSIVRAYRKNTEQFTVSDVQEIPGHGISVTQNGKNVLAGNAKLMKSRKITFQPVKEAGTVVYVAEDGKYRGAVLIEDEIKEDAAFAVSELKKAGVQKTVMLTGDTKAVGEKVAGKLGLDLVYTELLPADKVAHMEELLARTSEKGRLAFVGDGINDAPVLTRADVGIAMGALGSDAAIEAADIILMDDEPLALVDAVRIAKETLKVIRQNTVYAVLIKIIVLGLALCGMITIKGAIIWEVCVIVLAIVNAAWASKNPA